MQRDTPRVSRRRPSGLTLLLLALLLARPAVAQDVTIGIYADAAGTTCNLADTGPALLHAYVVAHSATTGITAARFAAPLPSCFQATYIGEENPPGTAVLGNSQAGVSVALGTCATMPVHLLTITYFVTGATPACCAYPVLADPIVGEVVVSGCDFFDYQAAGVANTINGDASCPCQPNRPPSAASAPWPAHDSWENPRTPVLTWSASDPDDDPLHYDVYFGADPEPPLVATALGDPAHAVGPLAYSTRYYWRVDVSDDDGHTVAGDVWSFVTIGSNPVNGDLTGDGFATPGDALCALRTWVNGGTPPAGCGGPLWDVRGDVDCNGAVTPGDGQCIFLEWLEGTCAFCTELDWAPASEAREVPRVTATATRLDDGRLALTVRAAGVAVLDAFGFDVTFPPRALRVASVRRGPRVEGFDFLEHAVTGEGTLRVGGFASAPSPAADGEAVVTVEFEVVGAVDASPITLDGFVDDLAGAPAVRVAAASPALVLHPNSPNPFRRGTEVAFELPGTHARRVRLAIYDIHGARVRTLVDETRGGGAARVAWDGRDAAGNPVASGVYLCRLESGGQSRVRKMVVLR